MHLLPNLRFRGGLCHYSAPCRQPDMVSPE
jgi:hypothetical protein